MTGRRIYVHLRHGLDADAYRERYLQGLEPDPTPYGFHLAEAEGYTLTFSKDHPADARSRVRLALIRRLGIDVVHAWRNRRAIARADCVWTMVDTDALAVAMLFLLRLAPRRPLIGNVVWLFDRWDGLQPWRQRLMRRLLGFFSLLTVHSERYLPLARALAPTTRSELMYFGISTDTFPVAPPERDDRDGPIRIVAAGNDRTRDWATLIEAFGNDSRFALTILCRWLDRDVAAGVSNLHVPERPTVADMRALYRDASFLAVPMHENLYSGITVALEAAAIGKPLLGSATGGLATYFDDDQMIVAPAGNAAALREAALATGPDERLAVARRAQVRFLERDYSQAGMMRRYAAATAAVLAD